MGGVVPDEVLRRHLPQWMLGISAPKQVRKIDNVEGNTINLEDGSVSHPGKELLVREQKTLLENSHPRVKCDPKRRTRKSKRWDADSDSNNAEILPDKDNSSSGRKVSAAMKRQRRRTTKLGISRELDVQPPNDDDVELTVEDLMIIAEEFVRKDKNVEEEHSSNGKCESESISTTISPTESIDLVNGKYLHRTSPTHDNSDSYKSYSSLKGEQTVISTSMTGDPAQDMLDLLLGPLLKKPVEKEKKTEFVMDDIAFYPKFDIQSQKAQNNISTKEVAVTTKKKSSLKDKVAMLLDR